MAPGDLITLCAKESRMVYNDDFRGDTWEPGEVGIFLGRHDRDLRMLEVLFKGRQGWVDEDVLMEVINEAG